MPRSTWQGSFALVACAACGQATPPSPPVAEIQLSVANLILEVGSSSTLGVVLRDADGNTLQGNTIQWRTSQPAIAEVDQSGKVTGIAPGEATITATSQGQVGSSTVRVLSQGLRAVLNVVDSTKLRLVVDSVRQANGTFLFETAAGAPPPTLAVGQVLVGAQAGGFLRRIIGVQVTGSQVTVSTAPAALTDVVRAGAIQGSTRLSLPAGAPTGTGQSHLPVGAIYWGPRTVHTSSGAPVVIRNGEIRLDDVVLFENGAGAYLKFSDGRIKFEPDFSLDMAISGGAFERLEAAATGVLSFDGDYELGLSAASASLSGEATLFVVSQPFFAYFGIPPFGIPVVGVVSLEFKGTVGIAASAQATLRTGFRSQGSVTVGGRYVRAASPSWEMLANSGASFTASPITANASVGVSAEVGLKAALRLTLYGVAGPYIFAHAKAKASRTIDVVAQSQRDRCVGTLDAGVGFDVSILSYALVRFERESNVVTLPFCAVDTPLTQMTDLTGRVYNAVTNGNIAGANVTVSRLGVPVATAQTNAQGIWTVTVADNLSYAVTASASGFMPASIVALTVNGPTVALPIPLVPSSASPGGISGRLLSATTNSAIPGGTIELRAGINATDGLPLATTTTNATGAYTFAGLSAGTYSVRGAASGFVEGTRTGIAVGGTTVTGQDIVLSPLGAASAVRIVLTWGATPNDLDSHLTGPLPGTSSRFHVYYFSRGSCTASPFACLDVDDVDGFGPETITVTQLFNGIYRYSVQNYSAAGNGGDPTSSTLATSNARVDVYVNNALRASFAVPQQLGTLWTVFTMDQSGAITPVNTVSGTPPPASPPSNGSALDTSNRIGKLISKGEKPFNLRSPPRWK